MLSHISITLSSLLWLLLWQERGETRGEEPGGWTQMPPPPPAGCQPSIFVLCPPLSFFKAISDFDLLANLLNHKFQLIICLKFAPFIFNRKKTHSDCLIDITTHAKNVLKATRIIPRHWSIVCIPADIDWPWTRNGTETVDERPNSQPIIRNNPLLIINNWVKSF